MVRVGLLNYYTPELRARRTNNCQQISAPAELGLLCPTHSMVQNPRTKLAAFARLKELQWNRYGRCNEVVQDFIKHRTKISAHSQADAFWRLYNWMFCPLTFWALDYLGIAKHVLDLIKRKQAFDADTILLLKLIETPPTEFAQSQVSEYEKTVVKGLYDRIMKKPKKFQQEDVLRSKDIGLHTCWNQIKSRFRLVKYRNPGGVVRRHLSKERNFDCHDKFAWRTKGQRFRVMLDALCYRFCLYGFEQDKPLLLKVSVNPTPYGTMIFVPKHMSLDGPRDLDWKAIGEIHRAHGNRRQGTALSSKRLLREAQREQALILDAQARKLKLKGRDRLQYNLREMKLDISRTSWMKGLLRNA